MIKTMRGRSSALLALLTTLVMALSACGGGSSTASGGGGGSAGTIAGTVDNGVAAVYPSGDRDYAFIALADTVVPAAHASGVAGVTVELLDGGGTVVATTTTDAGGNFVFTGLAPGNYSIRLSQGGSVLGVTPSLQVDSNTKTNIKLSLNGGVTSVEVEGEGNQISGEVGTSQGSNDSASQDDSPDDNSTAGDDSNDDNGAQDDSSEDDNSTDGSHDNSGSNDGSTDGSSDGSGQED